MGRVKKQSPVDPALTGYRPESQEIRKEPYGIAMQVQPIAVANLSMAITIGCVRKLERCESAMRRAKPLRAFSKHLVCKGLSDEHGQKFVKNDPLIVPAQLARCLVKHAIV